MPRSTDWKRVLQGALWAVALLAVVLAWWFPDAISQLRRVGAPYAEADRACDLADGPCEAAFSDGTVVRLFASPQPAGPTDPVDVRVEVDGNSVPTAVEVQGVEMAMGFLRLPLAAQDGAWTVTANLPVCTTERMLWKADVVLDDRVAGFYLWSTRT